MKRDRSVFVTNDFGYDLSDAMQYLEGDGELIAITEGKVNIADPEKIANKMMFTLKKMTKDDYLLISGNSVIACIASSLVFNKFKKMNLLIFDARENKYLSRKVSLDNLGNVGREKLHGNMKLKGINYE